MHQGSGWFQTEIRVVGDIIVVSVKEAIPRGRVKKGDVRKAVVVRTAKEVRREDGTAIRFDRNAAVILNNNNEPLAPVSLARLCVSCARRTS